MTETVYLIDHENLSKIDLTQVPAGARAMLFLGANDASVKRTLFTGAIKLGERLKLVEIEGSGKNALDFHIAFYLGAILTRTPGAKCVVLSKDKGLEPLMKHLSACGFNVEQADALATVKADQDQVCAGRRSALCSRTEGNQEAGRAGPATHARKAAEARRQHGEGQGRGRACAETRKATVQGWGGAG